MSDETPTRLEKSHRFLDEVGDTTFFGKGRVPILGQDGVSLCFGLGMVKFAAPVSEVRVHVEQLCRSVEVDDYLNRVPSVAKRIQSGGFYFHAKDDPSEVVFNVQNPRTEPLLCVPDYLGWTVQRVFERGDTRFYDFVRDRISLVVDLYDAENYEGSRNYYNPRRPLTAENKIGPPVS